MRGLVYINSQQSVRGSIKISLKIHQKEIPWRSDLLSALTMICCRCLEIYMTDKSLGRKCSTPIRSSRRWALTTSDWLPQIAFSATVWRRACLSRVCTVSCRPDDEVTTTSRHQSATVWPHKHLRDSPGGNTPLQGPRLPGEETFSSFNGSGAAVIEIFPCAHYTIVDGWAVRLPGLELFIPFYGSNWHMTEAFSHLSVHPHHCQVTFKVASFTVLPFHNLWLITKLLLFVFLSCQLPPYIPHRRTLKSHYLSCVTAKHPVCLPVADHWPLVNCQVCSSSSSFYGFLRVVDGLSFHLFLPLLFALTSWHLHHRFFKGQLQDHKQGQVWWFSLFSSYLNSVEDSRHPGPSRPNP